MSAVSARHRSRYDEGTALRDELDEAVAGQRS